MVSAKCAQCQVSLQILQSLTCPSAASDTTCPPPHLVQRGVAGQPSARVVPLAPHAVAPQRVQVVLAQHLHVNMEQNKQHLGEVTVENNCSQPSAAGPGSACAALGDGSIEF